MVGWETYRVLEVGLPSFLRCVGGARVSGSARESGGTFSWIGVPELRVRASGCDACRGSDKGLCCCLSGLCCHLALRLGPRIAGSRDTFFDSTHACHEQGPRRGGSSCALRSSEWLLITDYVQVRVDTRQDTRRDGDGEG